MHKIFIGYDHREDKTYRVAEYSIQKRASVPMSITPLEIIRNERWGLMRRPREMHGGRMYDVISDSPMSTEFANSRFLTPLLAQTGWALFMDCDMVVLDDLSKIFELADPHYAVMCVKHQHDPIESSKMDNQAQLSYPRKNWSSVMLFNCDHPANSGLSLTLLNTVPGRDLHRFCWLSDSEIGSLPMEWNWLVNVQAKPSDPKIAHFTLGGPWFHDWTPQPHDEIWYEALHDYQEQR